MGGTCTFFQPLGTSPILFKGDRPVSIHCGTPVRWPLPPSTSSQRCHSSPPCMDFSSLLLVPNAVPESSRGEAAFTRVTQEPLPSCCPPAAPSLPACLHFSSQRDSPSPAHLTENSSHGISEPFGKDTLAPVCQGNAIPAQQSLFLRKGPVAPEATGLLAALATQHCVGLGCIHSHVSSEPPRWKDWGGTTRVTSPSLLLQGCQSLTICSRLL